MALSSNLTTFSDVTDNAPLSPTYLNSKFGILDKNILQVNQTDLANNVFHVEDPAYGAVGGDTGDQTAAIQAAADAAIAAEGILTGTPGTTYKCTSALDFSDLKFCDLTGVKIHSTITTGYALTIGTSTVAFGTQNARLTLPEIYSDMTGSLGVDGNALPEGNGLLVKGLLDSIVYFQPIRVFEVGCTMAGADATKPLVYNDFYDISIHDCSVANLLIKPAVEATWCNDNRIFGGRLRINSTYANETGSTLMRIDDTGASSNPNGWSFYGITMEGVIINTMDIISGGYNTWYDCRWEAATDVTFGTECEANIIHGGSGSATLLAAGVLTDNSTKQTNGVVAHGVGQSVFRQLANLEDSATPHVTGTHYGQLHINGTTVTGFSGAHEGQVLTVVCSAATTTITYNVSTMRLAGSTDFVMASQDALTLLKYNATQWREISRTVA